MTIYFIETFGYTQNDILFQERLGAEIEIVDFLYEVPYGASYFNGNAIVRNL